MDLEPLRLSLCQIGTDSHAQAGETGSNLVLELSNGLARGVYLAAGYATANCH